MRPKFKSQYLGFGYKGLVFCRNNGWLMENMDKGLTVPKWVLINRTKIPQMIQNLSAQIVCSNQKVWDFDEKRLHWASVVHGHCHNHLSAVNIQGYLGCGNCTDWSFSNIFSCLSNLAYKIFIKHFYCFAIKFDKISCGKQVNAWK